MKIGRKRIMWRRGGRGGGGGGEDWRKEDWRRIRWREGLGRGGGLGRAVKKNPGKITRLPF